MPVRLTTLGDVRVYRDDTELTELPAQRLRQGLLVYLALERDVSREAVASLFWQDRDNAKAKHALRQMLYELRQVLGDDWVEIRRDRLIARVSVDAAEFEEAIAEQRVEDALRVYGGSFLRDFSLDNKSFESWAERRRAHLARLYRRVQREEIARLVESGKTEAAVAAARRWVELDPLEDEAAHALIERLAAAGQRAAALQYYESYEQQLWSELQVEPLEETRALIAAIRAGDALPAAPLRPAPPVEVRAPTEVPNARTAPASTPPRPRRRTFMGGGVAAAALVAAVTTVWMLLAARAETPQLQDPVILVQELRQHSSDGSLAPLASWLTEQLSQSLSRTQALVVIPPYGAGAVRETDSGAYRVDYIVGGSIASDNDTVRVTLELMNSRGAIILADGVEAAQDKTLALVSHFGDQAAQILRRGVGRDLERARLRANTDNEAAWELYLTAQRLRSESAAMTPTREFETMERLHIQADTLYIKAARLDPDWADPLVDRVRLRFNSAFVRIAGYPEDQAGRRRLFEEALEIVDDAIRRAPDHAEARTQRGAVLHQLALLARTPEESAVLLDSAEVELRRSLDLDPVQQEALTALAQLLIGRSEYAEAHALALRSYRIDPYSTDASLNMYQLWETSFALGDETEAQGWCQQARGASPGQPPFLYCLLALHAWSGSIPSKPEVLRRAIAAVPPKVLRIQANFPDKVEAMMAAAFARAGQRDSARASLARVQRSTDVDLLWMRAAAHVALDEDSIAIELLEESRRRGAANPLRNRAFEALRGNPAFDRLIADAR